MHRDRPGVSQLRVQSDDAPLRGEPFTFMFAGAAVPAHPGETIGAALLAAGIRDLRTTRQQGRPRGLFCGIGVCFDCLVTVNGVPSQRACLTPARPFDRVEAQVVPALD